jgi:hypothetical protein
MVIFDKWNKTEFHEDKTEYDTITEALEETKLLEEFYADTPRPKLLRHRYADTWYIGDYSWGDECFGEAFWGYAILDFEGEKVIKWGHDQLKYVKKTDDIRRVKDRFFRKAGEIPDGYKFDIGEYEGWLQYRWGDGKNAVKYGENAIVRSRRNKNECVRHCSVKKKKYSNTVYNENEEEELNRLNEEILKEINV